MANAKKQPTGADLTPQQVDDSSLVSEHAAGRGTIGILARDTRRDKVGRVMGHLGPYVQMRPPNGGCEWDARPEDVQPVSAQRAPRHTRIATNGDALPVVRPYIVVAEARRNGAAAW